MDFKDMSDEEILEHILEVFEEDARLSMNYLDIEVVDQGIGISGRVSSEEEMQIVVELMRDNLGVKDFRNDVWVDDTLSYEDHDDSSPDLKGLTTFDDDEIEDHEFNDDDGEEEAY